VEGGILTAHPRRTHDAALTSIRHRRTNAHRICFIDGDRTVGIPSELLPVSKKLKQHRQSLQGPAMADWQLEGILPGWQSGAERDHPGAVGSEEALFALPAADRAGGAPLWPSIPNGRAKAASTATSRSRHGNGRGGRSRADDLKAGGVEKDTFVIFTSDNGCAPYIGVKDLEGGVVSSGPLRNYENLRA